MYIIKRTLTQEEYARIKIQNAITKAFHSVHDGTEDDKISQIVDVIEQKIISAHESGKDVTVEFIQDLVEETLMQMSYFAVAKSYILYREKRAQKRLARKRLLDFVKEPLMDSLFVGIQDDFEEERYHLDRLTSKFQSFFKEGMSQAEKEDMLVKASVELTSQDAPKWEYVASRILYFFELRKIQAFWKSRLANNLYEKIAYFSEHHLYGDFILKNYSKAEILEAQSFIDESRTNLLTYSGLDLLLKRYVVTTKDKTIIETPQEMFLGIALHLSMKEKNRLEVVHQLYDALSLLKITMATPTLANARKPFHQLSSCFIDTVPDSLEGIYRSIDNFAQVSKFGGGMGLYFGKVRANGSTIRGFKGAAGGVIRWIKLANDTAVAVDQLGVRQGAVAVYLDAWHKDIPEFLQLRTNNGDDRAKAHDVFPAVCYPDLFWKMARDRIDEDWYMMCPHEVKSVKGYSLEDSYGKEWEEKYWDCVRDQRISKRVIPIKELIRLIIKSAVETGTPFTFNRDLVNEMNPNHHQGVIYCSNLCTEIAQNMSSIELLSQSIQMVQGEEVVVEITRPGNFVVCNLASLSLGNFDVDDDEELSRIIHTTVRALDNVIDLNYYPLPYAEITNRKMRPIGLGVSGYHHLLTKKGLRFESDEHLAYMDRLFERMNYHALHASMELAIEKGQYTYFEGSDYQTGLYFDKRHYDGQSWQILAKQIAKHGIRNGYLMAIAPTSSTSVISGTTAGVDPIMSKFFLEEKKNKIVPRVAPELSGETFWLYKSAHTIDQEWVVKSAGVRSRHIDQAQSVNLYITNDYSFRQILNLYVLAWEKGVKTLYYIRSKSLEVEECESCSS